ncbi:hypothetical protein [Streptacidiphilus sp. MAP12-16]|uniref:hypothetical protein n=1 Tax=Streptacidiphilus sp. MAP12-16 TaxID=3156300 RepID=UPI0035186E5E
MLTIALNDTAAAALATSGCGSVTASYEGLASGLRVRLDIGLALLGQILVWADCTSSFDGAPSSFPDLTAWECPNSSFHLEGHVPVRITYVDDAPVIADADQVLLLRQGLAITYGFDALVRRLLDAGAVRCIVSVGDSNATFRFHSIRPGEQHHHRELDAYHQEMVAVVDIVDAVGSGVSPTS